MMETTAQKSKMLLEHGINSSSVESLVALMPPEIDDYCLTIGKWFDEEAGKVMYAMTYERKFDGTIIPGCDINSETLVDAAVEMTLWLIKKPHSLSTEKINAKQDELRKKIKEL